MQTEEDMGMSEMNASSQSSNLNAIKSRIMELRNAAESREVGFSEDEEKLRGIATEIEKEMDEDFSEWSSYLSSLSSEELDEVLVRLKDVRDQLESDNAGVVRETIELQDKYFQEYAKMDCELEKLSCLLQIAESQKKHDDKEESLQIGVCRRSLDDDSNVKMLELSHQIETKKATLKSLQDLSHMYKSFEAAERLEDLLSGLKVIEIEGNTIWLSLKTYIPYTNHILSQHGVEIEPLELSHELMIETIDGTSDLKRVEIFPNDIQISEIVEAAKSFRCLWSGSSVIVSRFPLEWLVRKIQDNIALSALRRMVAKGMKSRHSFEYMDKEGVFKAHLASGMDATIKLPCGWPLTDSLLELTSLENKKLHPKGTSSFVFHNVMDIANSLNVETRRNMWTFVDYIEEILMQQKLKK